MTCRHNESIHIGTLFATEVFENRRCLHCDQVFMARQGLIRLRDQLFELHEVNGCCLHIAVEDYNLTDEHLCFCIRESERRGHVACGTLARRFMQEVPLEHREAFLGIETHPDGPHGFVHTPCTPWLGVVYL